MSSERVTQSLSLRVRKGLKDFVNIVKHLLISQVLLFIVTISFLEKVVAKLRWIIWHGLARGVILQNILKRMLLTREQDNVFHSLILA